MQTSRIEIGMHNSIMCEKHDSVLEHSTFTWGTLYLLV